MRLILALSLICSACLAFGEEDGDGKPAAPIWQIIDTQRPYIVNSGAPVEIIVFPDSEFLNILTNAMPGETTYGCLPYNRATGEYNIFIRGPYSMPAIVLLHEYEHLLEHKLPDQASRLRKVFHSLESPMFDVSAGDLRGDTEDHATDPHPPFQPEQPANDSPQAAP